MRQLADGHQGPHQGTDDTVDTRGLVPLSRPQTVSFGIWVELTWVELLFHARSE